MQTVKIDTNGVGTGKTIRRSFTPAGTVRKLGERGGHKVHWPMVLHRAAPGATGRTRTNAGHRTITGYAVCLRPSTRLRPVKYSELITSPTGQLVLFPTRKAPYQYFGHNIQIVPYYGFR